MHRFLSQMVVWSLLLSLALISAGTGIFVGVADVAAEDVPAHPVAAFEAKALALRNSTDVAFLEVQSAMEFVDTGEANATVVQDAIAAFYFTTSNASRSVMATLPIPEGLDPEVTGLLEQARRILLQSLQDRMALAAALAAGTVQEPGAADLARQFALRTGARDLSLNLVLQEARAAAE